MGSKWWTETLQQLTVDEKLFRRFPDVPWTKWKTRNNHTKSTVCSFISTFKCTSIMKGGRRWKGGDRLRNIDAWTYWEGDGAMLVQLSIVEMPLGLLKVEQVRKVFHMWTYGLKQCLRQVLGVYVNSTKIYMLSQGHCSFVSLHTVKSYWHRQKHLQLIFMKSFR